MSEPVERSARGVSAAYQPPPLTPVEIKPPRRGVSSAEKYAELEASGEERPKCECHGGPMRWNADSERSRGGRWVCVVKNRESAARYYRENLEECRTKGRESNARYYQENREKILEKNRMYRERRMEKDPLFRLSEDMRKRAYHGKCAIQRLKEAV